MTPSQRRTFVAVLIVLLVAGSLCYIRVRHVRSQRIRLLVSQFAASANHEVASERASYLQEYGPAAITALTEILPRMSPEAREYVPKLLEFIGPKAVTALAGALERPSGQGDSEQAATVAAPLLLDLYWNLRNFWGRFPHHGWAMYDWQKPDARWDRARETIEMALNRLGLDGHALLEQTEDAQRALDSTVVSLKDPVVKMFGDYGAAWCDVQACVSRRPKTIGLPEALLRWEIRNRNKDVTYCSSVILDKGENPLDGSFEERVEVGTSTEFSPSYDAEVAVLVTACREVGAVCGKAFGGKAFELGPCVGWTFSSSVGRVIAPQTGLVEWGRHRHEFSWYPTSSRFEGKRGGDVYVYWRSWRLCGYVESLEDARHAAVLWLTSHAR